MELTWFVIFKVLQYLSFEILGVDRFGRFGTKICEIQAKLWNKNF